MVACGPVARRKVRLSTLRHQVCAPSKVVELLGARIEAIQAELGVPLPPEEIELLVEDADLADAAREIEDGDVDLA